MSDLKSNIRAQFRGRRRAWMLAILLSTVITLAALAAARPTCDLMFHPGTVARNYGLFWFVLLLLIGLTNWGRLIVAVPVLIIATLVAPACVIKRVPANELSAVRRLKEITSRAGSAKNPAQAIEDVWGVEPLRSGYILETRSNHSSPHYVLSARPSCYCVSGQLSFALDESGAIHYTRENRPATLSDPLLRTD